MARKHDLFFHLNLILYFGLVIFFSPLISRQLDVNVQAESAILINGKTGAVLYAKDPDTPKYPASIIKIVTALYALEKNIPMNTEFTTSREAVKTINAYEKQKNFKKYPPYLLEHDVVAYGAKVGEIFQFDDLLAGIMLHSAGDFCNILAEGIEGSIPKYVECCNKFLKANQINSTVMMNPHGLHHPDQVTTARDMANIARIALRHPRFRQYTTTLVHNVPPTNINNQAVPILNSNRLLRKGSFYYPKCIGVKTGYMGAAKHTIVAAAEDEQGRLLIAVLLKEPQRNLIFSEAKMLFERAYAEQQQEKRFLEAGKLPFDLHMTKSKVALSVAAGQSIAYSYFPAEETPVKLEYAWNDLKLPIIKGDHVGSAKLLDSTGTVIQESPIYSLVDVEEPMLDKVIRFLKQKSTIYMLVVLGIAILIIAYRSRR